MSKEQGTPVTRRGAGYYSTSLRLKEPLNAFVNTNAFRRLTRLPFVRKATGDVRTLLRNPQLPGLSGLTRDEVLKAKDATGLVVHGVVDSVHWRQPLSDPNPKVRAAGLNGLLTALDDAKAFGATTVLLVPAVVNKQVSCKDAYVRSQAEIKQALPVAAKLKIKILFENVWNNFLLSPVEMARYIDEFESPWVGSYFDVGNIIRYGWPEHWIQALGKRIGKLDIKEYSRKLQHTKGPGAGFGVKIGEGDCDWRAVMKALKTVGYTGWATAEVRGGKRERLKDIADRMDRAFSKIATECVRADSDKSRNARLIHGHPRESIESVTRPPLNDRANPSIIRDRCAVIAGRVAETAMKWRRCRHPC